MCAACTGNGICNITVKNNNVKNVKDVLCVNIVVENNNVKEVEYVNIID